MRRYRFALEPVRRVRRIEQDAAAAALLSAQHDALDADAAHRELAERYDATVGTPPSGSTPRWLAQRAMADRVAASVLAASARAHDTQVDLAVRRQALLEARTRTSALDRLDERRREAHRIARQRAEDTTVDELVTARHGRIR